ncbi:MAG: hypothetical protein JRE81_15465 [Deltaproteobacteria bacterium]|nr:hypothetical protein [Deltaproteobacteria bacterium]
MKRTSKTRTQDVLWTISLSAAFALVLIFGSSPALAQEEQREEPAQEEEKASGEDLAQQARNPTASLTMMQVVLSHNPSFYNLEGADQTRLVVMPVIPFKTGKLQHIARVTLPFVLDGPDWGTLAGGDPGDAMPPNYVPTAEKSGLGDTALFDLLIFPAPWKGGKIAAGLSAVLPTASDPALGSEKWALGPAAGALVQSGKLLAGAIILANFSVAGASDRDDFRTMTIQPIGSYGLQNAWSVELSEMMFNYDFNSNQWATLPLGVRVGKLTTFGKLPVRFYGDVEYNFADSGVAPRWTIRFAFVPLL